MLRGLRAGLPLLLLLVAGCATPTARLPREEVRARMAAMHPKGALALDAFEKVVRAAPVPGQEIGLSFIRAAEPNAFSYGQGKVAITLGMLDLARGEEDLAAVLAHEVAHDLLGHVERKLALATGISIGFTMLNVFIPGAGWADLAVNPLATTAYSRSQELDADALGVWLYERAGYQREGFVGLLELIREKRGAEGGGFLSTHPGIDERIRRIRAGDFRVPPPFGDVPPGSRNLTGPVLSEGPEVTGRVGAGSARRSSCSAHQAQGPRRGLRYSGSNPSA